MQFLRTFPLVLVTAFASAALAQGAPKAATTPIDFVRGADLSILKVAEDHGVVYRIAGKPADPFTIFLTNGCNYVRLRLFVNPNGADGQVNTLEYTLALAKRAKAAGLRLLLDFHYSDGWADGDHQIIPAAWKDLPDEQVTKRVHDYTRDTLQAFAAAKCSPDVVAVGNEITNGMMWPVGGPMSSEDKWPPLIGLLNAGISALREAAPAGRIKVMIHLNCGGDVAVSDWFFSHCKAAKLDYDVIGLSYYPFWHGTLDDLSKNLAALATKYDKDLIVAETGYDATGDQGTLPFPTTPAGQQKFLERLIDVVAETPGGNGKGVIYWEPAWIEGDCWSGPSWSSTWESRALFDEHGDGRPALKAFAHNPATQPTMMP